MNSISNYDVYTERMQKTFYDKCWWINHISSEVDVIIDFGCADAGIFDFIDNMYPGRFTYIGIDTNEEMLRIARQTYKNNERASFYKSLRELSGISDRKDTVLIMNSVLHELFTYLNHIEILDFIDDIRRTRPAYIAVRDMHIAASEKGVLDFDSTAYREQLLSYKKTTVFDEKDINFSLEFLLKYLYPENWDREVREKYLWDWSSFFRNTLEKDIEYVYSEDGKDGVLKGYAREYEENFSVRFLQDKWKKDFGIDVSIPTHKKLLLRR